MMKSKFLISLLVISLIGGIIFLMNTPPNERISLFPLNNYSQNINGWIKPDANSQQRWLSREKQQQHFDIFKKHYIGELSPWHKNRINYILNQNPNIGTIEQLIIDHYTNAEKPEGYGINFRPYDVSWIQQIAQNIPIDKLGKIIYQNRQRAIAIDNLSLRQLPTNDVFFFNPKLPGQGFPFDNLQMTAIWAGTPLYVLQQSQDRAWTLVVTPELIGWVKSTGIAYVDDAFVKKWTHAAHKNLGAVIRTSTSIIDDEAKQFRFTTQIGAVFPIEIRGSTVKAWIPISDLHQQAKIRHASLSVQDITPMPLEPTVSQSVALISQLIGRPYGWGGLDFYNDCSAELKHLFTPFGVWLPRHSSHQMYVGKFVDLSQEEKHDRLEYLRKNGHPFSTIVYVGRHVFLYLGNFIDPVSKDNVILTYQNVWGLRPNPPNRRAVIGKAVLFPMLLKYPEDKKLVSLAGGSFFQITYIDQDPNTNELEKIPFSGMMGI
jgi:cell wall-associated NlpC family hydrolase